MTMSPASITSHLCPLSDRLVEARHCKAIADFGPQQQMSNTHAGTAVREESVFCPSGHVVMMANLSDVSNQLHVEHIHYMHAWLAPSTTLINLKLDQVLFKSKRRNHVLQVAHLGVTENDWRALAMAAAAALQLPEAVSAYRHLGDDQGLALMSATEAELLGGASMDLCTAKILRYQVLFSFIVQLGCELIDF